LRFGTGGLGGRFGRFFDDDDWQFGYQAIAGVRYNITPNVAFDLDYRYLATTRATFRVPGLARLVIVVALAGAAFLQLTSLAANRSAKTAETSLRTETAARAVTAPEKKGRIVS